MATLQIKAWEQSDFSPKDKGYAQGCSWGGTTSCREVAEFTVVDRAGANNGACVNHMVSFVRDRVGSPSK